MHMGCCTKHVPSPLIAWAPDPELTALVMVSQTKRTKVFGEWLIETDEPDTLEQPPTSDFWEGPQFEVSHFFWHKQLLLLLILWL